ncbi:hypothetical protein G7047_25930 [Diaphorobacter sp. HDW4A]|uniref:hypothetical protein n=1 Tax=Diaphorobacter sp. HDW4A TaxID=2714924 RepID=UPI00140AE693|nr:hypothetical protein [Diaphorobacter sp. HDW4A]QIL82994.1 hypothetical protein G7047_25930 [Diaphorobacter sp. HDW4A]
MDTVIVYVDDAEYARQLIQPALAQGATGQTTHWVLVACAPRMTHRISKWVSHSARESWRAKWADKLFAQLLPWLESGNAQVSTVLAKTPLPELMEQLQKQYGAQTRLLDARRPKQEGAMAPQAFVPNPPAVSAINAPAPTVTVKKPSRTWALPGTLAGLFCMMFVAVE